MQHHANKMCNWQNLFCSSITSSGSTCEICTTHSWACPIVSAALPQHILVTEKMIQFIFMAMIILGKIGNIRHQKVFKCWQLRDHNINLIKYLLNDLFRTCFTTSIQLVLVIYYFRTQVNQQRLMSSNIMDNDSYVTKQLSFNHVMIYVISSK